MQYIDVINKSARVSAADFAHLVEACALQVARDFAPAWGLTPQVVRAATAPNPADNVWTVLLLDTPDQPDALGYHEETGDEPDGKVFAAPVLDNGGVALRDPANPQNTSVASVLSHELIELIGDPEVNLYADGPAIAQGQSYAFELADPVQGVSYDVTCADGTVVAVSDFVLPAWFDPESTGKPTDFRGALTAPFKLAPGGYFVVRAGPGSEQQVLGEVPPPAWRERKRCAGCRCLRRCG